MPSLNDLWIAFLSRYDTEPTATHTADNTVTNASETILAANTSRKGLIIQNTHATEAVRVNLAGAVATTTNSLQIKAGNSITLSAPDCPQGAITAIREGAGDVTVHVVEFA